MWSTGADNPSPQQPAALPCSTISSTSSAGAPPASPAAPTSPVRPAHQFLALRGTVPGAHIVGVLRRHRRAALLRRGGERRERRLVNVYAYDPATDTWSPIASLPIRCGAPVTSGHGLRPRFRRLVMSTSPTSVSRTTRGPTRGRRSPPRTTPRSAAAAPAGSTRSAASGVTTDADVRAACRDSTTAAAALTSPGCPRPRSRGPSRPPRPAGQRRHVDASVEDRPAGRLSGAAHLQGRHPVHDRPGPRCHHVGPPAEWGKLAGTVTGLECCDTGGAPFERCDGRCRRPTPPTSASRPTPTARSRCGCRQPTGLSRSHCSAGAATSRPTRPG